MLFRSNFCENHTSGPKGRRDDKVNAGDKSPAYPKTAFYATAEAVPFVEPCCQPEAAKLRRRAGWMHLK